MKALIVGVGRVGSAVAGRLRDEGWEVVVVDESEEALGRLGPNWPGEFHLGHGMDTSVLERAGIADADAFVASTDGDNTNIVDRAGREAALRGSGGRRAHPRPGARRVLLGPRLRRRLADEHRDLRAERAASSSAGGELMFVVVVGGGKVGVSVTRTLLALGHELVLVEQEQARYERLEEEFQHRAIHGDATEIFVLEQAGLGRPPDIVVAVTGDDEDNIVICQLAKEKYGVPKVIARVNDPRNEPHFDLLGISPTVSATSMVLALVEHEVPAARARPPARAAQGESRDRRGRDQARAPPAAGKKVEDLHLPRTARLISVVRDGRAEIAVGSTELHAGDQVLAILEPGSEDDLKSVLL